MATVDTHAIPMLRGVCERLQPVSKERGRRFGTRVPSSHNMFNRKELHKNKWRRRESNECPRLCKVLNQQTLLNGTEDVAAFCQCQDVSDCLPLSAFDERLKRIIDAWGTLPPPTKDAILSLASGPPEVRDAIVTLIHASREE